MTKVFIRKITLVPEKSCFEMKPKTELTAQNLIEGFITLLKNAGFTNEDIDYALGTRREIKNLKCEIGKLKAYIDELEDKLKND